MGPVIVAMFCFVVAGACVTGFVITGSPWLAGLAVVNVGLALINLVTYRNSA